MNFNRFLIISSTAILTHSAFADPELLTPASSSLEAIFEQSKVLENDVKSPSYAEIYHLIMKTEQLPAEQQSVYWSNLLKTYIEASGQIQPSWGYEQAISAAFIYTTPSPDSWKMLSKDLAKLDLKNNDPDKKKGMQLLSLFIAGNQAGFKKALFEGADESSNHGGVNSLLGVRYGNYNDKFRELKSEFQSDYSNIQERMAILDKEILKAEKSKGAAVRNSYANLSIPALAKWLTEDEANSYYTKIAALMVSEEGPNQVTKMQFSFPSDKETLEGLAQALKLQKGKFNDSHRGLIEGLRDRDLLKRVSEVVEKLESHDQDSVMELDFDLSICDGDVERAKEVLKMVHGKRQLSAKQDTSKLDEFEVYQLQYMVGSSFTLKVNPKNLIEREKAFHTLVELLDTPGSELIWGSLNKLGLKLGKSDEVLELFAKAHPLNELTDLKDTESALAIADTYLALDDISSARQIRDKVTKIREESLNAILSKPDNERAAAFGGFDFSALVHHYQSEAKLAKALGEVEAAKEWNLKIVQLPQKIALEKLSNSARIYRNIQSSLVSSALNLAKAGHLQDAHKALVEQVRLTEHVQKVSKNRKSSYYWGSSYGEESLGEALVELYRLTGQAKEVIWLLENLPYWSKGNLFELSDSDLQLDAAWAFSEVGNKKMAYAILSRGLQNRNLLNKDKAYRQLLSLKDSKTPALIDELVKLNPYQERPLIWKAQMALDRGDFSEAEKLARKGIAIDPSDGEQGKDDRMQVYAVLSKALAGLGQKEDADVFNEVVEAIRMGERADSLYSAGLVKRALDKYNESLTRFADAYCLQSRLAVYYSDLGEIDKAEAHYQRAFELMPSSFGRIESHCFGCEGAFSSDTAKTIAGRVFSKAIAEKPDHPQNYYLMGYLAEARDQPEEAVKYYQKAVELDPEYINAWVKITEADIVPSDENLALQRKAKLNLIKLQPRKISNGDVGPLNFQIQEIYQILSDAPRSNIDDSVGYVLTAAKKRDAEQKKKVVDSSGLDESLTTELTQIIGEIDGDINGQNPARNIIYKNTMLNSLLRIVLEKNPY